MGRDIKKTQFHPFMGDQGPVVLRPRIPGFKGLTESKRDKFVLWTG